jgi:hypothetical protein
MERIMSTNPYLLVTLDAYAANARLVQGALGLGYGGLGTALVAVNDDAATYESTPLAWCALDLTGTTELVGILNGLCNGALPAGPIWGEDGVISSLDAQEAYMNEHSSVISLVNVPAASRLTTINGALAGMGYKLRPSAPEV